MPFASYANSNTVSLTIEMRSAKITYSLSGDDLKIEVINDPLNSLDFPISTQIVLGDKDSAYLKIAFKFIFEKLETQSSKGFDGDKWCMQVNHKSKCLWSPGVKDDSGVENEIYYLGVYFWNLTGFRMPDSSPYIVVNGIALRRPY